MMAKGRAGHLFGFVMDGVFGCSLALVILQVVSGQSSFGSSGPSFFGAEESTVVQVEQSSSPLPSSTLLSVVQSFVPPSTLLVQSSLPAVQPTQTSQTPLPSPLPTTSVPVVVESVATILAGNLSSVFVGTGTCSCDVLVEKCDVYCCCDEECTSYEQMSFQCSDTSPVDQVCLESDDILRSSLRSCSCPNPGAFCVQRDRNPSRLMFDDPVFVGSVEQFSSQLQEYGGPGDQPLLQVQMETYGDFYQVGDPVLVLWNTGELGYFSLPSPLNGFLCHDSNPIAYLLDETLACERPVVPLSSTCTSLPQLDPLTIVGSFSVLQMPTDLAGFDPGTIQTIPLSLMGIQCKDVDGEPVSCEATQPASPSYDNETGVCSSVLLEAHFSLIHNGTGEISDASVEITLGYISISVVNIVQQFGITFTKTGQPEVPLQRSGNPGYLDGLPVLAGTISEGEQIDISVDSGMWLVVRGSSEACEPNTTVVGVRFRESIITGCTLHLQVQELVDNCQSVRERTLACLTPTPSRTHVGIYGNSDPRDISQWVPILTLNVPESESQGSVGTVCQDVVTSLHIQVLYAYTGDFDDPSAIITGLQYTYGTEDIAALCRGSYCSVGSAIVPVRLQTAVTFTDVSEGPAQILQSTSDVVRQLPHDFLYPFFISNTARLFHCNKVLILLFTLSSLCYE